MTQTDTSLTATIELAGNHLEILAVLAAYTGREPEDTLKSMLEDGYRALREAEPAMFEGKPNLLQD